ncbi:MAG: DNA repair protein RecN [Candidatus Cyclobacteriaceae bacterium M3_2C_046]
MLKNLVIKNYALIQHLEMQPSTNLNIITGETGAGKSIMIGAVGLLLGNRADTKALYDEQEKCIIEGTFELDQYHLKPFFQEKDLDYDAVSILRREISPSGKSRAFINDTPVTLDVMKSLGSYLMDVHSQHDTLLLASNSYQLSIIDGFAQNQAPIQQYQADYKAFKSSEKAYEQLKQQADELNKEADYNHFLLEELEKAKLHAGEQETLEEELKLLENSEEIKLKLNQVLDNLNTSEFAAYAHVHGSVSALNGIASFSEKYQHLEERLESCMIELKDIINELEKEEEQVEFDPEKIAYAQERLSLIYQLQQKHQVQSLQALLQIQEELSQKAHQVLDLDDQLNQKKEFLEQNKDKMLESAQQLSQSRIQVFEKFCHQIQLLLKELGMPDATLRIEHQATSPAPTGIDKVNLLFSANKGIKALELKNVASGGEFSRLMFCVKYVLADKTALPTIVFDEVDVGISGEIALKMVKMMQVMAQKHQVLVITHLPQIASKGDTHYFVFKDNQSAKTVSKIRKLSVSERIEEVAKMIGGENPSAVAFENARELLDQ